MPGYLFLPEDEVFMDGWFDTGDLGNFLFFAFSYKDPQNWTCPGSTFFFMHLP